MLLRGMHDHGCDDVYIIVTDLKRQEMDDVTEYLKLVCRYAYGGRTCKPSIASQIQYNRSSSISCPESQDSFNLRFAQTCDCVIHYSSSDVLHVSPRSTLLSERSYTKKDHHSSSCSHIKQHLTPRFSSRILPSCPQRTSSSTFLVDAQTRAATTTAK